MTESHPLTSLKTWSHLILVIGSLMMLASIFYPFGYDQSAFAVAGEMVLKHGALPYRDFLDTKPPLIFYIYATASALFGHHEWSIRTFDVIFEFACVYYLYRIIVRYLSRGLSQLGAGLYLMLYAGTGFWMTAQAESFALLPSLVLLDAVLRNTGSSQRSSSRSEIGWEIGAGLSIVVLFLLKFTLIAAVPALIAFSVLTDGVTRRTIRFWIVTGATVLIALGSYVLWLHLTGALPRYLQAMEWVSRYADIIPMFAPDTIAGRYYRLFPAQLMMTVSPLLLLLAAWGTMRAISARGTAAQRLSLAVGLVFAAHMFGVLVERKLFPYHYSRAFFALAPLTAIGFDALLDRLRKTWHAVNALDVSRRWVGVVVFGVALASLAFYSPLTRIASQSLAWPLFRLKGSDTYRAIHDRIPDYFPADQIAVSHYIDQERISSIFLWGNDVGLYFYSDRLPTTSCLTATPYRTTWTPVRWRASLMRQLERTMPDLFVVQYGDSKWFITGSDDDSYTALTKWPALSRFVATNYVPDTTIRHFYLYRRRSR